ncbi:hypothetical protein BV25DRAFT_1827265 [Artomyces pyxidatus]|uniref:Uncharacterized protein n=1 Tax=Artomyces pyxidatus TaxID=48021 RepID=A0ACB8SYI9_9AGAM|nr:hypothetical protein BV25DRAFT_1827265 [Artomyces pyxidatus]
MEKGCAAAFRRADVVETDGANGFWPHLVRGCRQMPNVHRVCSIVLNGLFVAGKIKQLVNIEQFPFSPFLTSMAGRRRGGKYQPSHRTAVGETVAQTRRKIDGTTETRHVPLQKRMFQPSSRPSFASYLPTIEEEQAVEYAALQPEAPDPEPTSNYIPTHAVNAEWRKEWGPKMLESLLSHEAAQDLGQPCALCGCADALTRCRECFYRRILCKDCAVKTHVDNPFHQMEYWEGTYFRRTSLRELGLVIRLGHGGKPCPFAQPTATVTIVHTNGIHTCDVDYCGCMPPGEYVPVATPLQLANAGLFPATFKQPRTATTFQASREFNQFTLQAKINAQDYHAVKLRLTNNAFRDDVPDRYRQILTSHRQFAFLQTLKRFGESVREKYSPGSLVVLCPACAQPGKNMDPNWRDTPKEDEYIHALIYAKDGNFQQSQHKKKMDLLDSAFTRGGGYYADEVECACYLASVADDPESSKETSTCSKFHAVSAGRFDGKQVSGVISMVCAPHGLVMGSGTVDLTKGERFSHVDFATVSATRPYKDLKLHISSYDINCQYGINFDKRMANFPGGPPVFPETRRCIPKFHLPAHKGECKHRNSFYLTEGVGMTDGESVERRWAVQNAIALSAREMGPGYRHDTLNDHNGDYNMQKVFKMAAFLVDKLDQAKPAAELSESAFQRSEITFRLRNRPIENWSAQLEEFNRKIQDPMWRKKSIRSPYEPAGDKAPTEKQALETLKRDAGLLDDDDDAEAEQGMTGYLKLGLDLEGRQYDLRCKIKDNGYSPTNAMKTAVEEARARLELQIQRLETLHTKVLGSTTHSLKSSLKLEKTFTWPATRDEQDVMPEDVILLLPSSFPEPVLKHLQFKSYVGAELLLRKGRACDNLRELRLKISMKSFLWRSNKDSFGQVAKTRHQNVVQRAYKASARLRDLYNSTRMKMLVLGLEPTDINFQPLTEDDCRVVALLHAVEKPGQSTREDRSWLWRDGQYRASTSTAAEAQWDEELDRLTWFRANAKRTRWREQVKRVEESIRMTQRHWYDDQQIWLERAAHPGDSLSERGAAAYAAKQAAMYARLLKEAQDKYPEYLRMSPEQMAKHG